MDPRKHQKKREKKKRARLEKKKRARQGLGGGPLLIHSPPGEVKMSEVLMELIEPYSEFLGSEETLNKILPLAIMAWNAALFSGNQREEAIQKVIDTVPAEIQSDTRSMMEEMIQRKLTLFPHIKRVILDYQLTMRETGPHLSVISTFV